MYREITKELIKWKDNSRRKPLILTGVRQCGKTYIVDEFGKNHFKNVAHLNFEESENAGAIFEYDFDVNRIIKELGYLTGEKIIAGETLLFFDEIQNCPRAITALKYFCENKRDLHVVCAGSLLGVAIKRDKLAFPVGKVNRLQLYPMSFKEFVMACGRSDLIEMLKEWPTDRAVPDLYAVPMKKLLKEYYIVGGMPEAVQTWIDTNDYDEVTDVVCRLKSLAMTLNVPFIILSQTNRPEHKEATDSIYTPKLSDLRDSGTIEDVSDMVMFIHRPEYYHIYQFQYRIILYQWLLCHY